MSAAHLVKALWEMWLRWVDALLHGVAWLLARPRWSAVALVCVLLFDGTLLIWPTVALGALLGVLNGALVGALLTLAYTL